MSLFLARWHAYVPRPCLFALRPPILVSLRRVVPPCTSSLNCVPLVTLCNASVRSSLGVRLTRTRTRTRTALQTVYGSSLLVEARAGDGTDREDLPPQVRKEKTLTLTLTLTLRGWHRRG